MKVKLKKGESLSSMNNHCGLKHKDWISLNQGKEVDLDSIPKHIADQIENKVAKQQKVKEGK